MALLIARHGQTDWNVAHRWQSRSDIPLNARGLSASQKTWRFIEGSRIRPDPDVFITA